jgi:hypothetical protein
MADIPSSSRKDTVDALLLALPGVSARKINGLDAYFVSDKMFACLSHEGVGLRLPAAMTSELLFSNGNYISAYSPGGVATTREWVELRRAEAAEYAKDRDLFEASVEYVKKGRR